MKIFDILRRFDAYPKTLEDPIKSITGAAITIISTTIVIVLILSEFVVYLSPKRAEELFVDTTRGHKLRINLDITVPKISCGFLTLDAMDSAGDQHLHIEQNVYKRRLDLDGKPVDETPPLKEKILTSADSKQKSECGSCYGAEQNSTHCCNTCQDVLLAYRAKQWNAHAMNFEQCKEDEALTLLNSERALKEGCQIYGHMEVNRMGGSFHIAPGKSYSLNHVHLHDVHPLQSKQLDTSHVINHLSFGDRIEFANTHPLDKMEVNTKKGDIMYHYYLKIVPTMYIKANGELINTNQFSVTRHQKDLGDGMEIGMPGIFFTYELSPLMVKYTEKDRSLGHFATNVCSIIGGVFTVAGIIVSILHNSLKVLDKQIDLNKHS